MRSQSLHSLWHKNFFELFKLLDYITLRYNLILSTFLQFYFLILTAQECSFEKINEFVMKTRLFSLLDVSKSWILLQSNFQLLWNAISFTVSPKKTHFTVLLQHWSINYDRSIISHIYYVTYMYYPPIFMTHFLGRWSSFNRWSWRFISMNVLGLILVVWVNN